MDFPPVYHNGPESDGNFPLHCSTDRPPRLSFQSPESTPTRDRTFDFIAAPQRFELQVWTSKQVLLAACTLRGQSSTRCMAQVLRFELAATLALSASRPTPIFSLKHLNNTTQVSRVINMFKGDSRLLRAALQRQRSGDCLPRDETISLLVIHDNAIDCKSRVVPNFFSCLWTVIFSAGSIFTPSPLGLGVNSAPFGSGWPFLGGQFQFCLSSSC